MDKSFANRVVRALRRPPPATHQLLTSLQSLPRPAGRSRFERVARVLYRELVFQLDFFDAAIADFRTFWYVAAWGRPPAPAYPISCADSPLRATCSLPRQQRSALAAVPPAFRNRRRAGRRRWRLDSPHLN